jgi:hypothetical protein
VRQAAAAALALDKPDGGGELGHIRNNKRWKKKAHEDYIWLVMRLATCTLQIKYIRPGSGWKQTRSTLTLARCSSTTDQLYTKTKMELEWQKMKENMACVPSHWPMKELQ